MRLYQLKRKQHIIIIIKNKKTIEGSRWAYWAHYTFYLHIQNVSTYRKTVNWDLKYENYMTISNMSIIFQTILWELLTKVIVVGLATRLLGSVLKISSFKFFLDNSTFKMTMLQKYNVKNCPIIFANNLKIVKDCSYLSPTSLLRETLHFLDMSHSLIIITSNLKIDT